MLICPYCALMLLCSFAVMLLCSYVTSRTHSQRGSGYRQAGASAERLRGGEGDDGGRGEQDRVAAWWERASPQEGALRSERTAEKPSADGARSEYAEGV
jgi:hypothetical protein